MAAAFRDLLSHIATESDVYAAPLTPALAASLKPEWARLGTAFRKRGSVQSITLVERGGTAALPTYGYRVRFTTESRLYLVTLDQAGKIADFKGKDDD